jgi:Na+-translocating ferredoxin:NAD+ oxidoreductase RnfC subunit
MKERRTILRVEATYHLTVQAGDAVRRGQKIQEVPDTGESPVAPVSGTIESIRFDPADHEFVIVITSKS